MRVSEGIRKIYGSRKFPRVLVIHIFTTKIEIAERLRDDPYDISPAATSQRVTYENAKISSSTMYNSVSI